jgi:DNA-nicking Smr family endonuclease
MTSKNTTISDAERELFRHETKGVNRLHHDKVTHVSKPPRVNFNHADEMSPTVSTRHFQDPAFPEDISSSEFLSYQRPGIQLTTLRKLRRATLPIFAELDLHGHTIEQAREAMEILFSQARPNRQPCVRIVHGRGLSSVNGEAVLKKRVDYWLRQQSDVLAFFSAPPSHGGTGAVYVLLKNKRAGS